MFDLDGLRTQVQLHNHIALRDMPKRVAAIQIPIVFIWMLVSPVIALVSLAWLAVFEAIFYWLVKTTPEVSEISKPRAYAILINSLVLCFGYYGPGVVLAVQPDFGLATGGLVWILAALTTNLAMYHTLRLFYWSTALVAIPAALIAVFSKFTHDVTPATTLSLLLLSGIVFMQIANSLQQMGESRDTHQELETTRVELLRNIRKLEFMSLHDALTGLANRAAFVKDLDRLLSEVSKHPPIGVIMIDLNGFKPVNDTYGHEAGDAVLVCAAFRLENALRREATAYRLGGDEFAVISPVSSEKELRKLADRLSDVIREPMEIDQKSLAIGASVGAVWNAQTGVTPDQLCAAADRAMYVAKRTKARHAILGEIDLTDIARALDRRIELELALRRQRILPHYQPKFSADGVTQVGFQALARWHVEDGSVRNPKDFVGDMDEMGLLPELTRVMLNQILRDISAWRDNGHNPGRVSLNMPVVMLTTEAGREELTWLISEYAGYERFLAFEITEDAYLSRAGDAVAATLRHFMDLGIEIYLDDFGTGYASYRHLRDLSPHEIKIDGSLVADLGKSPQAKVLIEGIVNIAHGLGCAATAENVETEEQRALLQSVGCDYFEGYLAAPALPAHEVDKMLLQIVGTTIIKRSGA